MRDWLAAHPDIAVVSRDRAGPYAEAARLGALQAIQVADRWHLLVNASEALRSRVERHQAEIRKAARQAASQDPPATVVAVAPADPPPTQDAGQGGGRRRGRRRQRCAAALRLHGEGMAIKTIVRRLRASHNGVRRWRRAGAFVPYRRAPAPSRLDAHLRFVEVRWQNGQHNAAGLYRELRAIGFEGGYEIVQRWAKRRRQRLPTRPPSARVPSTRRIARWLTSDPASLPPEDRRFVAALCGRAPRLQAAAEQVRGFGAMEEPIFNAWYPR